MLKFNFYSTRKNQFLLLVLIKLPLIKTYFIENVEIILIENIKAYSILYNTIIIFRKREWILKKYPIIYVRG